MFAKIQSSKIIILLSIFILLFLPLVSAYNGWGYGRYSFSNLLENELVMFSLIFLVFFALTYFALGKTMKENKGAAVVIAIIISLFITFAISQRTYYTGYLGEKIGSWLLVIALILGLLILIKFVAGFGLFYLLVILFIGWFFLKEIEPYDVFPEEILASGFFSFWEFFAGGGFLFLLIIVTIVLFALAYGGKDNDRKKSWQKRLWGGGGKRKFYGMYEE